MFYSVFKYWPLKYFDHAFVFVWLLFCSVISILTKIFANTTPSCFQRNFSEKNIIVVHFSKAGEEVAILRTRNNLVRLTQDWTANCSSMKGHLKLTKCVASKKRSKTAMMHVWPRGGLLKRSYRNLIDENSYNRDTRHYFMLNWSLKSQETQKIFGTAGALLVKTV